MNPANHSGNKQPWSSERFWKNLESSGLLLQFIRCSTIPQPFDNPVVYVSYDDLIKCLPLIGKKFIEGEPCGDVVQAILKGTDGSKQKNEKVMTHVRNLAKMGDTFQSSVERGQNMKMCRNCNKQGTAAGPQKSLMVCSQCKQAYYCSKECQKEDWKLHKYNCTVVDDKKLVKSKETKENGISKFTQDNYLEILDEIIKVMDETGLPKEELLLEVTFAPDRAGLVPALKTPAEFSIKDTRGYFEGTRPNEPDWFLKREDPGSYEGYITGILSGLKDQYSRMTPNNLLCLARFPDSCTALRLTLQFPQKKSQMFANTTIHAYRTALDEGDFGPMSRIFDDNHMVWLKPTISAKRSSIQNMFNMPDDGELPDEDQLDRVRMMLNTMGGNFDLRGSGRR